MWLEGGPVNMASQLRKPTERTCERCGRQEAWEEDVGVWRVRTVDGESRPGNVYCIHEWNINGSFAPLE
jgi:hypothetical protein